LGGSFCAQELLSLRIIEPPVERALQPILFRRSVSVAEEADETLFWFELLVEAELLRRKLFEPLMNECEELLKIFSASLATAKHNR
jgi:hypothetical protein